MPPAPGGATGYAQRAFVIISVIDTVGRIGGYSVVPESLLAFRYRRNAAQAYTVVTVAH